MIVIRVIIGLIAGVFAFYFRFVTHDGGLPFWVSAFVQDACLIPWLLPGCLCNFAACAANGWKMPMFIGPLDIKITDWQHVEANANTALPWLCDQWWLIGFSVGDLFLFGGIIVSIASGWPWRRAKVPS